MNTAELSTKIDQAAADGHLLASAARNLKDWAAGGFLPDWALASIAELVAGAHWDELNDRFYTFLAFGTGGMRNRTIGTRVTAAERGTSAADAAPAHAAVGTAVLNDFNIVRATIGLFRYCQRYLTERHGFAETPRLVIAHDVRHFSRHFCELTASTWTRLGGFAMIFDGPRSTPHLSYAVRATQATAGIVITASHNPPHDNGYKVYFSDGAQVVFPHAEGIIHEVYQVGMAETVPFLDKQLAGVVTLPKSLDADYLAVVQEVLIDPTVFDKARLRVVFSPIHGTGAISGVPTLEAAGVEVVTVPEQLAFDARFPTVKSPNPENPPALHMAMALADAQGIDIVMATDPDADRLGVAVRNPSGKLELLTGNQTGSLLAAYRIERMKELGLLPPQGTHNAVLIKTFVTTPLQASIARQHGLKVIDTLTGFKWIGEKLLDYEQQCVAGVLATTGIAMNYDATPLATRRALLLEHSTFYVFGGEESYGYLASDRIRDKDGNAALLMFAELAAWLQARGLSFAEYLDEVYLRYGYYLEDTINIYYEGATGAQRIRNILESYRAAPPAAIGDYTVTDFRDFGVQDLEDTDGKPVPKQDFYFVDLDNGYTFAVRGSGTEPKIKFYLFAREDVAQPADLDAAKQRAVATLATLKDALLADAGARADVA
jgi:phosphoglucomutase